MAAVDLHNFPVELTSFVGRRSEIDHVRRLIGDHRLVSLVGPGGVGKTRLAARVVGETIEVESAWFIDLSVTRDPEMVSHVIAEPFNIGDIATSGSRALIEVLADFFETRQVLVVLDNCEHLVDEVSRSVGYLMGRCPGIRVLTTSRIPLRLEGEIVFRVSPLEVSEDSGARPEAVTLFLDRLAQVDATHRPEDEELNVIAEIARRLDGLPLAIELAASRTKLLSAAQVLDRLVDRFEFLQRRGAGTERHETLQATIEWSYELLEPGEQRALHYLSVFSGWSLDAAEAMLGADAFELLAGLVDKSLVEVVTGTRENRYRMLETVREYGLQRLAHSGEEEEARVRHADYYLSLAERASKWLITDKQAEWLEVVRADHDNIRQVLNWALEEHRGDVALRMVASMGRYWFMHTLWSHALHWYRRATELARDDHPLLWARAYLNTGTIKTITQTEEDPTEALSALEIIRKQGTTSELARATYAVAEVKSVKEDAQQMMAESIRLARDAEDPWMEAYVKRWLGSKVELFGAAEANVAYQQEAVEGFTTLGDRWSAGWIAFDLGTSLMAFERFEEARAAFEKALSLVEEIDERLVEAHAIRGLGSVAAGLGRHREAEALLERSIPLFERIGDDNCISLARVNLADVRTAKGNTDSVPALLQSAAAGFTRVSNNPGVAAALRRLAEQALVAGESQHATRLLGASEAFGGTGQLSPNEKARADTVGERVRSSMDAPELRRLLDEGAAMSATLLISETMTRLVDGSTAAEPVETADQPSWPSKHQAILDYIKSAWSVEGDIHLLRSLGGKSGASVMAVDLTCRGHDGQAILKLETAEWSDPAEQEASRHRQAWADSPGFADDHLPRLVHSAQHGDATAMLATIASRGLEYTVAWARASYSDQTDSGKRVMSDLLYKWNDGYRLADSVITPPQIIDSWLGYRLDPDKGRIHSFVEGLGADPETATLIWQGHWYPNPLPFARGVVPAGPAIRPASGSTHGDLHGHNVLIRTGDKGLPWFLIDLAFYEPDALLFFDQAYFELSHILETRISKPLTGWGTLLDSLDGVTEPESDELGLVLLLRSMRDTVWEWVEDREADRMAAMESQIYLARIAVGLNFTHKRVPVDLKSRGFVYAMHALKSYLGFHASDWPKGGPSVTFPG